MANQNERKALIAGVLIAAIVALIAISNASFWIDEGGTGLTSMQPTLTAWWDSMRWERNSNMQLPLYLLMLWAWAKVFGHGEWALRMFNFPCFLLTVAAMWLAFKDQLRLFLFSLLFLISSAFVWFYLDQARPYAFFLTGSMFLFAAVYRFWRERTWTQKWGWWLTVALLLVSSTSIIGLEWAALTLVALWYAGGWTFPVKFLRSFQSASVLLIFGMAGATAYYIWSLKIGADVPKYGRNGVLLNLAFLTYEFFGFTGWGPGRNALRTEPLGSLSEFWLPLAIFGLIVLAVIFYGRGRVAKGGKFRSLVFYALLALPAPVMILAGEIRNVRLLPRHLTPLLPLVVLLLGTLLARCWDRQWQGRFLVVAFLVGNTISAGQIRFSPRHARDDYRSAASLAKSEVVQGDRILWIADPQTAIYYGLIRPTDWATGGTSSILLFDSGVSRLPKSHTVVFYSKPDLYDTQGRVLSFLLGNSFSVTQQFQAFQVWRSPS